MSQSHSCVLIHLVFSTKSRSGILPHDPYHELHAYAAGIIREQKCHLIEMNNVADHVHLLFDLHRTAAIADFVMHVKKGTSRWIKEQSARFARFDWQNGYGAFSIGRSQREEEVAYIRMQQAHHARTTFQDEFRALLMRYDIEFDERYVWG